MSAINDAEFEALIPRTDALRFTAYVVDSTMRRLDCDVVHASEYAKLERELTETLEQRDNFEALYLGSVGTLK